MESLPWALDDFVLVLVSGLRKIVIFNQSDKNSKEREGRFFLNERNLNCECGFRSDKTMHNVIRML